MIYNPPKGEEIYRASPTIGRTKLIQITTVCFGTEEATKYLEEHTDEKVIAVDGPLILLAKSSEGEF